MTINYLINEYLNTTKGESVSSRLKFLKAGEVHFHGITDPAKGFFLLSLVYSINRPILYLANDSTAALNLYHEIFSFIPNNLSYFCGQEVSPYDQISSDTEVISHQTRTLTGLIKNNQKPLIISTAKYLLEKIWNKEDLIKHSFEITPEVKIETKSLSERLIRLGYKKNTMVTNRGEFSSRGDIFDIYPMIGEPARIEFFGDEIQSIRIYSLITQRSQESITKVLVTPRYYVINTDQKKLKDSVTKIRRIDDSLSEILKSEKEQIETNNYFESLEYYSQLVNQRTSSLFDYLPEDTIIITDDWESNAISIESWYQRNIEIKNELESNKKIIPLEDLLLFHPETVLSKLKNYSRAFLDRFELFDQSNSASINLELDPAMRFHNQLEKFSEYLKEITSLNYRTIIFTDQPQRVKGILREWNIPGVYEEDIKDGEFNKQNIVISKEGTTSGFVINPAKITVFTDQEIFGTKRKPNFLKKLYKQDNYQYYSNIEDLKPNDYVVHIKHGIGKYRGLVKMTLDNVDREYLMIEYASEGKLYLPVEQINMLYRYRGSAEVVPKLSKLGGNDWELTKKKVKKAVKRIAEDLLNLYTARSKLDGFAFNSDSHWQIEMEESFPYTETPDQWKAICEVKTSMESTKPMDRLICGDVGYGKTEVALRAIFKAVLSGKQVAVLVPTTILAQQHFNVISERLAPYPTKVAMLSRFVSNKEQKQIIGKVGLGEVDVVIGTHRLLQNDVKFKDLGLVVIDEEQRFGVTHKEKLKHLRVTVDVLTLSATPIPRTLHMALSGARDMSLINTPPANRLPIKTFVGESKTTIIKTAILHELERGGQIYFVHNRIESIYKVAAFIKELVPEANIVVAHGQMQDNELENVMFDFMQKKYNVLVCTTIIESGIDIPSVNTIIIDNSDQMGLAQLYQLRGRVGRAEIQAYAYCLYEADKVITETAKNRLQAIKEFSNLGSGYQIALRDMEIRGVGNILGSEQHGHMISVGFDFYCELLNEAVDKLRGLEVNDPELECVVDLNINAYIPSSYIEYEQQKVTEYKRLANVRTSKNLEYIKSEWKDRFGNYPQEVDNLIRIVELRILANSTGIKYIKSENISGNIKIDLNARLEKWLNIQDKLPQSFKGRISFKSSARGSSQTSYLIARTGALSSSEQLDLLFSIIEHMKIHNLNEKIA